MTTARYFPLFQVSGKRIYHTEAAVAPASGTAVSLWLAVDEGAWSSRTLSNTQTVGCEIGGPVQPQSNTGAVNVAIGGNWPEDRSLLSPMVTDTADSPISHAERVPAVARTAPLRRCIFSCHKVRARVSSASGSWGGDGETATDARVPGGEPALAVGTAVAGRAFASG